MKFRVYVEYLNFFWRIKAHYGIYWVNLESLFLHLIRTKVPNATLEKTIVYTAPFLDEDLVKNQEILHKAWVANSKNLYIDKGYHSTFPKKGKLVKAGELNNNLVSVEFPEEKQTDVNIACQIVQDAYTEKNKFDAAAVVTNDTDLSRALKIKNETNQDMYLIRNCPERSQTFNPPKIPYELARYIRVSNRINEIRKQDLLLNICSDKVGKIKKPPDESWLNKKSKK